MGGTYFLKLLASNKMWLFSKKQYKTRWLIFIVGLNTIETFCIVILLKRSRSMTCPIWTNIQVNKVLLASGIEEISCFIPSIRFWGLELAETCSNLGIKSSVNTGSGNSLKYWKKRANIYWKDSPRKNGNPHMIHQKQKNEPFSNRVAAAAHVLH